MSYAPFLPMVGNTPKIFDQTGFAVDVERLDIHNALLFEHFCIGEWVRQKPARVGAQGANHDGLGLAVQVVFAAISAKPPRLAQGEKPGGFVTCASKPAGINKRFCNQDGVAIGRLPISGQASHVLA